MSTFGSQVLYREATGLEKAWSDVDADRITDTNAEAIIDIWDPYRCPIQLLPFLAWAMGVTFWNDSWSETTKRQWLARQWEFKSYRGTEAGLAMALDFAGRDVTPFGYNLVGVITQPQKVFSGPTLTKAQREAWLVQLPQVRVYYFRNVTNQSIYKAFLGSAKFNMLTNRRFYMPGTFIVPSEAKKHLDRKAVYVVNGVETDINVTDFGNFFQLHLRSVEGKKIFSGRPFGHNSRFFQPSDAWRRLITISPTPVTPWRIATGPSYTAVTSQPETVKIAGTRGYAVFSGQNKTHDTGGTPMGVGFFLPSTARYRIFERYAVYDGSPLNQQPRPNVQFMGVGRYGWPKFTAEVDAHIPSKRSQFAAGDIVFIPKRRFWIPHDPQPMKYVRASLEASRRLSDKLLLRPVPIARFVAGRAFVAGIDSYYVRRPAA